MAIKFDVNVIYTTHSFTEEEFGEVTKRHAKLIGEIAYRYPYVYFGYMSNGSTGLKGKGKLMAAVSEYHTEAIVECMNLMEIIDEEATPEEE